MGRVKIVSIYIIVACMLLLPEVVLEMFHALLELLTEVGHTLFEILEVTLDLIVEHAFHTDLHQTQIIVFYILFLMVLFWLRSIWRAWPAYFQRKKEKFCAAHEQRKTVMREYWYSKSLLNKIVVICIVCTFLGLLLMFM